MPPFSTNRRTEATQDLPRSPSRILPKSRDVTYYLSLQKQSIKHIHQNITDNSLHTASHNNQYSYAPCILQKVQDKRSNVTKSGYKRKQIQSACTRINQSIVRQHCKHNEESGKNQSNFKFERVTAVLIFRLIGHILGASMTGMDKPRNNGSYHRHNQKIRIDRCKYLPAKDQNQYHKTQKHHADRKQHSSYIFVRLLLGSLSTFTGQYRNCGSTTI